jgi:cyclopropane-fatty-acyl-phospholipid synthase
MHDSIRAFPLAPRPGPLDPLLRHFLARSLGAARLRISLRDGTLLFEPPEPPVAAVVLADRRAVLALAFDPEVHFGDAYASGRIEIEGDLLEALLATFAARRTRHERRAVTAWGHTRHASRDNVHHHYDLGDDFYRLWLDDEMVYTCAYFEKPQASLEAAQAAKLDYVCRKIGLKPGDRVVEAGCGWGALALHMARRFGAHVTAYNVSTEQIRYARGRASKEGLADRVQFVEDDYRNISGRFDAFVSVGMLEHVGLEQFGTLGGLIERCLDPVKGRGLLHFIGQNHHAALNPWIRKRIFPGAYPPSLAECARRVLEMADVDILDVENLRRHYALTLSHWRARYESAFAEVVRRYGSFFARAWRLYLAGSEAAFRASTLQLYQVVFARPGAERSRHRAALYTPGYGEL